MNAYEVRSRCSQGKFLPHHLLKSQAQLFTLDNELLLLLLQYTRLATDPVLLFNHFFSVAFFSTWILLTNPRRVGVPGSKKLELVRPSLVEYPFLLVTALRTVSVHLSSAHRFSLLTFIFPGLTRSGRRLWCSHPYYGQRFVGGNRWTLNYFGMYFPSTSQTHKHVIHLHACYVPTNLS